MPSTADKVTLAKYVWEELQKSYPEVKSALDFSNVVECWVAVLLSVQCTDKRVNTITPILFARYKTFEDYANAKSEDIANIIKPLGYFNSKTKYLINGARKIVEDYHGKFPQDIDDAIKIPGIGRKVANVILSESYEINSGIAVDTHNIRVTNRIGLTNQKDQGKIEEDLMESYPRKIWNKVSLTFIEHGRQICTARNPKCQQCRLKNVCKYYKDNSKN